MTVNLSIKRTAREEPHEAAHFKSYAAPNVVVLLHA